MISIAIHGGAGTILKSHMTPEKETAYKNALQTALDDGYRALSNGLSSVDAVEFAVTSLENCHLFNAGKGSVFTANGTHEMDASIMNGQNLSAGAVSTVTGIKNPVKLARLIMEESDHVFLSGSGAEAFGRLKNCDFEEDTYFFDQLRFDQWQELKGTTKTQLDHSNKNHKYGTVGAVALDRMGNLAAATSTGGMTNKKFGRIGDSPIIGAGTYANNNTCAVSCTGSGEFFIRAVVAYDVSCLMEYQNMTLNEACLKVVNEKLKDIGGDGGMIAIDRQGNTTLVFNTDGMYRGRKDETGINEVLIYR